MPAAGKNCAGNPAAQRSEEGQKAIVEEELSVAAAEFDAVGWFNFVGGCGIDLKMVERVESFARFAQRSLLRGKRGSAQAKKNRGEGKVEPHACSVFRLGMKRQGCLDAAASEE